MNKIYKVIWSKVKHQYVVTSEFAHSCAKSTTSRVGKSALAALAAFVLTAGVGGVQAAAYDVTVGSDTTTTRVSITAEVLQKMLSDAGIPVGNVDGEHSIAIGEGSSVRDGSLSAMAIGHNAMAGKDNTLAVGTSAAAGSKGSIAIGSKAKANYGLNAMALGNEATAVGTQSVAIGYKSQVTADHKKQQSADNAIALGTGATVKVAEKAKSADNAIALGKNATIEAVSDRATVNNAIAIGTKSYVKGGESIAIGNDAKALNSHVVAIGRQSTAKGGHSVALGYQSNANAEASTALGYQATANGTNSIALGAFSQAGTNAVALGKGSVAEDDTVSVGNDTLKRKIVNVAAGTDVDETVTVGQLQAISDEATKVIHGVTLDNGNVITAEGANLNAINKRTASIQQLGATTIINNKLAVNEVGVSIPGTDGSTAVWMRTNGDIEATGTMQAYDFTTEDGLSLRDVNATVTKNNEGVVRYLKDESGKYTDDVAIEGNMEAANVTTTEGADLNAINKRTANIQQLGATTIINNKLAVNEVGVSIPGTDGSTAVWMRTNGDIEATGTMQAYDFTTEDGLSLRDVNATVTKNNEGVVRYLKDESGKYTDDVAIEGNMEAANVTTTEGADLNAINKRTANIQQLGETTIINNKLAVNEVGVSIPGTDGNTAVWMQTNGNVTATGTMQAYDFTTEDGLSLRDLNTTVSTNNEGVVRWDTDANGKYVDGSLRGMHFLDKKEGIVSFGDNKVLINGMRGQVFADSIGANDVTTQSFTAGNGKVKVDKNGKLSTTGEVSMMNGTGELVSLTDDNGLTMMTSGDYGTGMLTMDNGRINMRGGTTTTITIDNSGTTFTNLKDNTSTTIQGNTITTGTIHADGMTVGGKDVATVDDVTNATKDAVKYDEKGELHAGKDGTGSLALEKENGSASLISGNGKHSISVGNDGTTINGGLNVNDGLTVDGDTVATSGDVTEVKADVSGIKKQIGVAENQTVSNALTNKGETLVAGINQNTAAIGDVTALKGTNANGEKYTNLTDAVNGNYDRIEQNTTAIAQNSQAINSLGHRVSDLGDEIDSVGAISAALAGLHPLDYDGTGSKFQISAAMGTYDGTQAAAIGGFYHFNRDVMMSLGGATSFEGDKKTAANIGVTFRVGEGASGKTVSNDILARLEAMDQKIAALEQENKELKNVLGAIDTSLSKEFPDVPANHWAYEAVTKLAGNDVVDGYPDGEFHGDRTMTRYEMAEIIYKAMNRGAKVDQKLVEEFKPEMEQVAANETAQAQSTPAQEAPAQDAQ